MCSLQLDKMFRLAFSAALVSKSPPRGAGKGNKLMKILGPETPQHYITKLNAEQKPWYLRPNYDQSEILIDSADGSVRAGTQAALVERLTAHESGGNSCAVCECHK